MSHTDVELGPVDYVVIAFPLAVLLAESDIEEIGQGLEPGSAAAVLV